MNALTTEAQLKQTKAAGAQPQGESLVNKAAHALNVAAYGEEAVAQAKVTSEAEKIAADSGQAADKDTYEALAVLLGNDGNK